MGGCFSTPASAASMTLRLPLVATYLVYRGIVKERDPDRK